MSTFPQRTVAIQSSLSAVRTVVRGTRYYSAHAAIASGMLKVGTPVKLVRQPSNPHDANAVAVVLEGGEMIGHISKELAPKYGRAVERGEVQACVVTSVGGRYASRVEIEVRVRSAELPSAGIAGRVVGAGRSLGTTLLRTSAQALPAGPGCYCLVNVKRGALYIGASVDVRERAMNHIRDLRAGKHHCAPLQHDVEALGADHFRFEIIERTTSYHEALQVERRRIREAISASRVLYNMTETGEGRVPAKMQAPGSMSVTERGMPRAIRAHHYAQPPESGASSGINWCAIVGATALVLLLLGICT